jgi:ubiquinone/menaquinone biosynthesis C-methylase UbiE/uncharacterized protein YbaR (Trm112 family)
VYSEHLCTAGIARRNLIRSSAFKGRQRKSRMHTKLISILASPCCRADLHLEGLETDTQEDISEGILTCTACRNEFPIIDGILRILTDLSETEKNALSVIKERGLSIRQQATLDAEARYQEIEKIIRREAPDTAASEYLKRRFENDLEFRVHGCEMQNKYAQTLKKYYTEPTRVMIDVGAGQGGLTKCLNDHFKPEISIILDYEIKWAEIARLRNPNVEILRGDAAKLPFKDRSIDLVISQAMLEHVKEYDKAANELCRVAQKACFIAWSPNKYSVYDFGHLDAPVTIFSKPLAGHVAKWWHGLRRTGRSYKSIIAELDDTFYIPTTYVRNIMLRYGSVYNVFAEFAMNSLMSDYTYRGAKLKRLLASAPFVSRPLFSMLAFFRIEPNCYYILRRNQ